MTVVPDGGDARLSLDLAATFETGAAEIVAPGDPEMPGESQRFLVAAGQTEGWLTLRATYGSYTSDFRVFVSAVTVRLNPPVVLISAPEFQVGPTTATLTIEGENDAIFTGKAATNALTEVGEDIAVELVSMAADRKSMAVRLTAAANAKLGCFTLAPEMRQRSAGRQVKTYTAAASQVEGWRPQKARLTPASEGGSLTPGLPGLIGVGEKIEVACRWEQSPDATVRPDWIRVVAAPARRADGHAGQAWTPTTGAVRVRPTREADWTKAPPERSATAVWGYMTKALHDKGDDYNIWTDLTTPPKDQLDGLGGALGLRPIDSKGVRNMIVMQFTVIPAGVGKESGVAFDVTRRMQGGQWWLSGERITHLKADWPLLVEKANDDPPAEIDESLAPTSQNHSYVADAPGTASDLRGAYDLFAARINFQEFLRVRFDGVRPSSNTLQGSRCSPYFEWHESHRLEPSTIDNTKWQRSTGDDPEEPGVNDIGSDHIDVGTVP